jgi:hypothetical protein
MAGGWGNHALGKFIFSTLAEAKVPETNFPKPTQISENRLFSSVIPRQSNFVICCFQNRLYLRVPTWDPCHISYTTAEINLHQGKDYWQPGA